MSCSCANIPFPDWNATMELHPDPKIQTSYKLIIFYLIRYNKFKLKFRSLCCGNQEKNILTLMYWIENRFNKTHTIHFKKSFPSAFCLHTLCLCSNYKALHGFVMCISTQTAMVHELLTSLWNTDQQLNIAVMMLIYLTHAHGVHRIQTLVWINTIGGTAICAPEWQRMYIYIPAHQG